MAKEMELSQTDMLINKSILEEPDLSSIFTQQSSDSGKQKPDMSANVAYLTLFMILVDIPAVLLYYSVSYHNQLTTLFEIKFEIEPKHKVTFNSAIGAVVIVGLGFGSVFGGILMKIGRRHSLMIANITGLVGVALTAGTFYRSIPLLMVGRFVFGFAGGLISSIGPRLIEESVPAHLYGQLAITFNLGMNTGTIFSFAWAEVLPSDEDIAALESTNLWIFPYLVFPSLLFIITLLGQTFIVTEDSIKFLIVNKKEEEARAQIRKMYKHSTNDKKADAIIESIRDTISTSSS